MPVGLPLGTGVVVRQSELQVKLFFFPVPEFEAYCSRGVDSLAWGHLPQFILSASVLPYIEYISVVFGSEYCFPQQLQAHDPREVLAFLGLLSIIFQQSSVAGPLMYDS